MSKLSLTIATTDYDHFRDFRTGAVQAEGIDHNWLNLGHHECFARFTANREFDLSELSFAKFAAQATRADADIVGLRALRRRPLSLRHRGEPPDLGADGAVYAPAGHRAPPLHARGHFRPGRRHQGRDLRLFHHAQAGVQRGGAVEEEPDLARVARERGRALEFAARFLEPPELL